MADPVELPSPPVATAPGAAGPAFALGTVLATTFRVFGRHLLPFGATAVMFFAPATGLEFVASRDDARPLFAALGAVLYGVVVAGVTRGTLDVLGGARPGFGRMLQAGATRGLRVLGAGLASGLVLLVGLVFLVVPGLVAAAGLYVAQPAVVAEDGLGSVASVSRSWSLTEEHRWGTLVTVLLFQGISVGVSLLPGLLIRGLATEPRAAWAVWFGGQVLASLSVALYGVAAAVTYHALRTEKEGVAAPELVKVFE